jgi:hypothetical protein
MGRVKMKKKRMNEWEERRRERKGYWIWWVPCKGQYSDIF